jgi:hypothetical protein
MIVGEGIVYFAILPMVDIQNQNKCKMLIAGIGMSLMIDDINFGPINLLSFTTSFMFI